MNTCENNLINPNWDEHGYIQVYTGNGKGKTTASLGLAMRALGRCWKVLIVMFTKGGDDYGELNSFMNLAPTIKDNLKIIQAGTDRVIYKDNKNADDEKSIIKGWELAKQAIHSDEYKLIILCDRWRLCECYDRVDNGQYRFFGRKYWSGCRKYGGRNDGNRDIVRYNQFTYR